MTSKRKNRLGKGLGAIIPEKIDEVPEDVEEATRKVAEIALDNIISNRHQPRKEFNEVAMEELRNSIQEHGIIQPITVRQTEEGFELIAGERRLKACRDLNMERIPAYVLPIQTEVEMLGLALIENVQREDLNPVEEAEAYMMLAEKFDLSHKEVAESVGKSRTTISNALRLLDLPDQIKKDLRNGDLRAGHARPLLKIKDKNQQIKLWKKIKDNNLSARDVEKLARDIKNKKKTKKTKKTKKSKQKKKPPYIREFEDRAMHAIDAKVRVNGTTNKGKLEIEYYSSEDLNRLMELFDSLER
ncbi:MAG: ParB/RepB/Spo0J family partition protein [Candidatus Marinimicrobia bacterium]|nr:ParB/RepB/Spo0J family partition protein [Candidatus Neomarinimicrobiota bacterium]